MFAPITLPTRIQDSLRNQVRQLGDGTITLLLGKGDGTFSQAAGSPNAAGQFPYQITAADFNGDGKLDLVVTNVVTNSTDGTVSILLRSGSR